MRSLVYDKKGRRPRDVPISSGKWVSPYRDKKNRIPNEQVFTWFEVLHRHGDLPTPYLHEFTRHVVKSVARAGEKLTDLFHEDWTPHEGAYLARPGYQWLTYKRLNTRVPVTEPLVYANTENALAALQDAGRWRSNTPEASNSPRHDFNRSCITASIHLATRRAPRGYEYIFHDAIVDLIGTDRFTVSRTLLKPDCLFGIRYLQTGAAIIFALEVDRQGSRPAWKRKLALYRDLIGRGAYENVFWKGARLMLASVFDSPGKMRHVMNDALKLSADAGYSYMLFRSVPRFMGPFVPPPVMPELFDEPYPRASREPFNISRPPARG